jgi:hypothetical protein
VGEWIASRSPTEIAERGRRSRTPS